MRAIALAAAVLLAASAVAQEAVLKLELPRRWHPPAFAVHGIDVSRYQGRIDWKQVAESGVGFVYVKATEGSTLRDPMFRRNWEGARRHVGKVGAYHFFTFNTPGAAQARNLIATLPKSDGMLAPAVDVEFYARQDCAKITCPSAEKFRAELQTFLDLIEAEYGQRPVLYIEWNAYHHFGLQEMAARYPFWLPLKAEEYLVDGYDVNNVMFGPEPLYWQHSIKGRVPGIAGDVDLNVAVNP